MIVSVLPLSSVAKVRVRVHRHKQHSWACHTCSLGVCSPPLLFGSGPGVIIIEIIGSFIHSFVANHSCMSSRGVGGHIRCR